MESNSPLLHIAAIPHPGRGHMNPMLSLCRSLLASNDNLLISFITTQEWLDIITSEPSASPMPPNLLLVPIPNVLPQERSCVTDKLGFVMAVQTKMEGPVETAMTDGTRPRVDAVVADVSLPWAASICKRQGLPVAALWTQSAAVLWALQRFASLDALEQLPADFPAGTEEDEVFAYIPRVNTRGFTDAPAIEHYRFYLPLFSWFTSAQSLLLSSPYHLESEIIDKLKNSDLSSLPIYAIGPSIPYTTLSDPPPMETDYFKWLDSQPSCSVLYISLGSFLSASSEQVDEMVIGLNASGARYLWVAPEWHPELKGLDGERGIRVKWCDQLRVLCHPAVGGFLTHCGLNSTLEGVYAGIPMLTFPLFWDQYPNSKNIVDDWKIGLRLKDEKTERVIGGEDVARIVSELMDLEAEGGKRIRRRAAELKEECRKAVGEGGSSSACLDEFVQEMIRKKKERID